MRIKSKSRIKPLSASVLALLCTLACRQPPVARLQAQPRTLTLPYPHQASLELTWLPRIPLEVTAGELMVFVHLIDREGKVQRTFDHPFPDTWTAGSEVTYRLDLHQSAIARPLPPGDYDLTLGLYAASGRRWPLDAGEPEVAGGEYALAEVEIPYPVKATPRFNFLGAWEAPQETGLRQIMATRWLSDKSAELTIWGIDRPGEAVLSFTIPRLQEDGFRLRMMAPEKTGSPEPIPTVAVESDCGGVRGRLSGYGSREIRVTVPASAADRRCRVSFVPSSYFIDSEGSRRFSALLESAIWVPAESEHEGGSDQPTHRRLITRSPEDWSVSLPRAAKPETIILRNAGDRIVVSPRVIVNRRKDWFNADTLLAEILEPGYSDRDKALAIWEFLVANRYHDIPAHHNYEMHDPVRLLNVYGYGFCDDASNSFAMLARKAGLRARIWHLKGHVVSEAYYDGGWHLFDADGEVFYTFGDDETIAGVRRVTLNPDLIRRNPSPNPLYHDTEHMVDLYTSRGNNRVADWYHGKPRHVMAFDLRPGESILRSRRNWGLYVVSRFQTEPVAYGNGRFTFEPVLRDGLFRRGATEVTGVRVEDTGEDRRTLVFAASGRADRARLTYAFLSPYPVLSGRVRIVGELRGHGTVELALSRDGEQWSRVWASSVAGEVDTQVSLDRFLPRDSERPVYRYHLRIAYEARAEASQWRVETLRFESDFQLAPHSLPSFEEGANEVLYVDASEGEREVELIFDYGD